MQERLALGALVLNALIWGLSWWPFRLLAEHGLHTLWATALLYALAWAGLAAWQPAACRAAARLPSIWLAAAAAGGDGATGGTPATGGPGAAAGGACGPGAGSRVSTRHSTAPRCTHGGRISIPRRWASWTSRSGG